MLKTCSTENLKKQLEDLLALPKEDPHANKIITTLQSNIEKLEVTIDSLRTTIAEKDQQSDMKDRRFKEMVAEFQTLKVCLSIHIWLACSKIEDRRSMMISRSKFMALRKKRYLTLCYCL